MASPAFMRFSPLRRAAAFGTLLGLAGCQSWLDDRYADSLPPTSGVQPIRAWRKTYRSGATRWACH